MSLSPFIAHLEGWKGGEVFLLLVDHEGVQWLMSQFERIAKASIESVSVQFVLGGGRPVESDQRCLLLVELNQNSNGSQIARISPSAWRWTVSRSAADKFRTLLSSQASSFQTPAISISIPITMKVLPLRSVAVNMRSTL